MLSGVHSGFIFRKVRDCDGFVGGGLQQINAPLRREEWLLVVRMEATLCEIAPCKERSVHNVSLLGHAEPYASTSAPSFSPLTVDPQRYPCFGAAITSLRCILITEESGGYGSLKEVVVFTFDHDLLSTLTICSQHCDASPQI